MFVYMRYTTRGILLSSSVISSYYVTYSHYSLLLFWCCRIWAIMPVC